MPKIPAIVAATAIVIMIGLAVTKGEHAAPQAHLDGLMPSTLQMMSETRNLSSTPFVAP